MKDKLHPIIKLLAELLPGEEWRDGEKSFDIEIPYKPQGRSTSIFRIPRIKISLNREQYEYIKENI